MNTLTYEQKTKIVATIGPSSSSKETLREIIEEGASVLRLNFSHGDHSTHVAVISDVRALNEELGTHVCILQDLQGPKIRFRDIEHGQVELVRGNDLAITVENVLGTSSLLSTSYSQLPKDVRKGQIILINDGTIELKIKGIEANLVHTVVTHGGTVKSKQGLNLPQTATSLCALTEKDKEDLALGLAHDIEWVALSFVRHAKDVKHLRELIVQAGSRAKIIAKIEKPEALENISDIIRSSDAIMVARGDLGVEIPTEEVPIAQKNIVKECNKMARPVIIATHMMESMIESTRPTRAEATDVANAVIDGADAVMLSAETATGKHPILATRTMRSILHAVERKMPQIYEKKHELETTSVRFTSDRLVQSACILRKALEARAIVSLTDSGYSAFRISSFRPETDIFIFCNHLHTVRTLSLAWGVRAFYYDRSESTDQTIIDIEQILRKEVTLKPKNTFIMLTSMPVSRKHITNTLKVNVVED